MRKQRWALGIASAALLSLTLAACGDDDDMDGMNMGGGATMTSPVMGTMPANPTMDHSGVTSSPAADTDPDLVFIDAMIVHHGSAVAMAEVALDEAEHQEIEDLAEAIIEAQNQEIGQMEEWRNQWYPDAPESDLDAMSDMAGMNMSDADMQLLREATDFDKMFIDMMIPHHESAIQMAEALQETTERPELQELAGNIIESQQAEIAQMQAWRAEWYGE